MYEVIRDGEYIPFLTSLVSGAEERVYISSYVASVSKPVIRFLKELDLAARRGADVRVLLDGVGEAAEKYNASFAERASGTMVMVRLTDFFNHVKLAIIDDTVVVGSHNLVGPSRRRDISVAVASEVLARVATRAFMTMWGGKLWTGSASVYIGSGAMIELWGGRSIIEKARALIKYAVERVSAAFFVATVSRATREIYEHLAAKRSEGVDVLVLLSGEPGSVARYNKETVAYLRRRRVPALIYPGILHAKVLVADEAVLLGSQNLTSSSVAGRAEISVVVWVAGTADVIHSQIRRLAEEAVNAEHTT